MKRLAIICATLILSAMHLSVIAQITIGSKERPEEFSALELISEVGGLRHPQMNTVERDKLLENITDKSGALGLTIFNTDIKCLEFYKSEQAGWLNLCDEQSVSEIPLYTDATLRPFVESDGSISTGNFGKEKFDVAQINSGGSCGTLSTEAGRGGDFQVSKDYTRNYVIDFTSISGVKNLLVGKYQDPYGIIKSVSGGVNGDLITLENKVLVSFVDNINTLAKGTSEHNALKATIYGIFAKDGLLKRVEYTITVMDCLGCGVRVSADQSWIPTMCYNLGADASKNPLIYDAALEGDSYQWGRQADGHEKKNSDIYYPKIPLGKIDYSTVPLEELNSNGSLKSTSPRYGLFIPSTYACQQHFYYDWSAQHNETIWGDATQRLIVRKGNADPCPEGFRLPTHLEMEKIMEELTIDISIEGAKGRDRSTIFLPYSSYRDVKGMLALSSKARYWTSTIYDSTDKKQIWALDLSNITGKDKSLIATERSYSGSVRCIAE